MKAYPIPYCHICPDIRYESQFDECGNELNTIPKCLYFWHKGTGEKRDIDDPMKISEWCPLKKYVE